MDYVVLNGNGDWDLALETKWVSGKQRDLPFRLLADFVRLRLLVPGKTKRAFLVLAGKRSRVDRLLSHVLFDHAGSSSVPVKAGSKAVLCLDIPPRRCGKMFTRVMRFYEDVLGPYRTVRLKCVSACRPEFPLGVAYAVYVWRVR
jgi:hypothetical protein